MIVVKLMGGLGNQLFQYAAAKALAMKRNTDLVLDLSFLNKDPLGQHTPRQLELHLLTTDYKIADTNDLESFAEPNKLKRFLSRFISHTEVVNEKGFEYDEHFFDYPKNTYLNGFWQSEKYFNHIRHTLLRDFSPKNELNKLSHQVADEMPDINSVALHIRRGDYVSNQNASEFHGLLEIDYYHAAITYIKERTKDPLRIFVFSDDIAWAKENLKTQEDCTYIDFNKGEESIFDLYLMSQCQNNIIANSSFSWWGAWLNQYPDKIVVAPKNWFRSKSLNTKDLIPDEWVKL